MFSLDVVEQNLVRTLVEVGPQQAASPQGQQRSLSLKR